MENKAPLFSFLLTLAIFCCAGNTQAQVLVQSFDTLTSLSQFEGSPPTIGQVDTISMKKYSNGTLPFYLEGEQDKYLLINKSNNSQLRHFNRSTDINDESFLRISFNFSVDSASSTGKFAGIFVGDSLRSERWASIGLYVTDTNSFYVTNESPKVGEVRTRAYAGEHRISVFLNNSGEDVIYMGPDDRMSSISDGFVVIWIDNLPLLTSSAFEGASSAINAVKFLLWGNSITALARLDDLIITDDINIDPLPVELLSFKAKRQAKNVKLEWQTATELNNSHFVVERSGDGISFKGIGKVEGAGTTQELNSYEFTDKSASLSLSPALYYRLLQVDFDGASVYSPVVMVGMPMAGRAAVKAHPNPFQDQLTIRLNALQEQEVSIRLLNSWGKVVFQEEWQAAPNAKGMAELKLSAPEYLEAGLYVLELSAAGFREQYSLIKR